MQMSSFDMADTTWSEIRSLNDTTSQPLVGDIANGADLRLLGYPVIIDNAMPATATGNKAIAFGAISDAFMVRATNVRIEASRDALFAEDQTSFRAVVGLDSNVIDSSAIKVITMG